MLSIEKYDFSNKKVIVRVDFNVPLDANFNITDDTRIRAAIPTIQKILEKGGTVILMSHLGRPKGVDKKFSLQHIVPRLSELLGKPVKFATDCIGEEAKKAVNELEIGGVLVLENLRFHAEEKRGDAEFAKQLAELADVWVNDAFGTAHRAHGSTAVIAQYFPKDKMFGYVIENELKSVDKVLNEAKKPFTAIMGGSKVSSKITIIENLLGKVDNLIIGGGMTYTFVKAAGGNIGNSIHEDEYLNLANELVAKAEEKGTKLYLATDALVADDFSNDANTKVVDVKAIPENWEGLDIGKESIKCFKEVIANSQTILWNGPVGVFEMETFEKGTKAVAEAIVEATKKGAFSLIGGGDSVAAINKYNMADKVKSFHYSKDKRLPKQYGQSFYFKPFLPF